MQFSSKTINAGSNAKTVKGDGSEYVTAIMYLAPYTMAGGTNTCPMAEQAGCIEACLNTAGRGAFSNVQQARINKTVRFQSDRKAFMAQLHKDVDRFARKVSAKGAQPCVRLNGTSDIRWESVAYEFNGVKFANIMAAFPDVQFYDYTKIGNRRNLPENYHLTFSYSAVNSRYEQLSWDMAKAGINVAVVFSGKVPTEFMGRPVINGDADDMRFLDPQGVIVALKAKGKAKRDESGFVVHYEREQAAYMAGLAARIERARNDVERNGLMSDKQHLNDLHLSMHNAKINADSLLTL